MGNIEPTLARTAIWAQPTSLDGTEMAVRSAETSGMAAQTIFFPAKPIRAMCGDGQGFPHFLWRTEAPRFRASDFWEN
jgi:hypothetical protein